MTTRPPALRRATSGDAAAVAAMHVRAWQVAYRGIVPDDFLDGLDVAARAARYAFDPPRPADPVTWIALDGNEVVGMVSFGPGRDDDLAGLGEVRALYVAPDRWRSGTGTALIAAAEAALAEAGFREAFLWVLEDNGPARRFYEASGWTADGRAKTVVIGGRELPEVSYRRTLPDAVPAIRTTRFDLVSMSLAFMKALRDGDLETAAREIGAALAPGMREDLANFLSFRIPDLESDPSWQSWLGRAIVLAHPDGSRQVIGTIGFHAPPDATGRVEIGYRVEPAFRRRGVATECVAALLAWAEAQGIHRFRASVAPDNVASLAIVRSFGFRQVGVQMDEIDGEELVFELDRAPAPTVAAGR